MLGNLTKPQSHCKLWNVIKQKKLIKSYYEQILDSIDTDADMEKQIFESSEFERKVSELIISINMWLMSHDDEVMSDRTVPYPIQNSNFQNSNISFWPRPRSIHSNTSLAPVTKFSYVKTLLTGKAKDALNSLELTSGNYDEAVATLKSRFGDPQVVIQSNVDILLALHPVSSSSNITELRKIYDEVETVSRNLQHLEVHAEHFGPILIAVLTLFFL